MRLGERDRRGTQGVSPRFGLGLARLSRRGTPVTAESVQWRLVAKRILLLGRDGTCALGSMCHGP
eukprot:3361549-Prymnesium_polylepis.1